MMTEQNAELGRPLGGNAGVTESKASMGGNEGMKCPLCGKTNYSNWRSPFFECFECDSAFTTKDTKAPKEFYTSAPTPALVCMNISAAYANWNGKGSDPNVMKGRFVQIAHPGDDLAVQRGLAAMGWEVAAYDGTQRIRKANDKPDEFDVEGQADLCLIWDTMSASQDPGKAIALARDILRIGGVLAIHCPDFKRYHLEPAGEWSSQAWRRRHVSAVSVQLLAERHGFVTLGKEWNTFWRTGHTALPQSFTWWGGKK